MTARPDLARYHEMMAERSLTPFYREPWVNPRTGRVESGVLGEPDHFRWRVSGDEWDRLLAMLEGMDAERHAPGPGISLRIFGFPVEADAVLPPRSIILEPVE